MAEVLVIESFCWLLFTHAAGPMAYLLKHLEQLFVKVHDQQAALSLVLQQQVVGQGSSKAALEAIVPLCMCGLHKLVQGCVQSFILLTGLCSLWHYWQHV